MPTPRTSHDPLAALDDPDTVGASEYRAVHELLVDGTSDLPAGERLTMAGAMLEETRRYVDEIEQRLGTSPPRTLGVEDERDVAHSVDMQVIAMLRRRYGDAAIEDALEAAAEAFDANAREYEKTGAFDPASQYALAEAARTRLAALREAREHPGDDVPF